MMIILTILMLLILDDGDEDEDIKLQWKPVTKISNIKLAVETHDRG